MRISTSLSLAVALIAAGCSRDLGLPSSDPLRASSPVPLVAPREQVLLEAAGGAGGYTFAFAPGGKLSGDDATVEGTTGSYRAGALGSAVDAVEVTDGAGARTTVRISVGQRLSLTPPVAGTAPGGEVTLAVSGGLRPYTCVVEPAGSASLIELVGGSACRYRAAADAGDAVETVVVTDATGDPAARAEGQIRVGRALQLIAATAGHPAPGGTVDLVAFGGQPPYVYSLFDNRSGGSIDVITGRYTAGASGGDLGVSDVARVTDDNLLHVDLTIQVGPVLGLALPAYAVAAPGEPITLVATGGMPPYSFAFAPRGNRSGGTVNPYTGDWTPGPTPLALDIIQVTDATGTAVRTLLAPAVGPFRAHPSRTTSNCLSGDFDGDGRRDALFVPGHGQSPMSIWRRGETGTIEEPTVSFAQFGGQIFSLDPNVDRHADLLALTAMNAQTQLLVSDLSGGFYGGPSIATCPSALGGCPYSGSRSYLPASGRTVVYTATFCGDTVGGIYGVQRITWYGSTAMLECPTLAGFEAAFWTPPAAAGPVMVAGSPAALAWSWGAGPSMAWTPIDPDTEALGAPVSIDFPTGLVLATPAGWDETVFRFLYSGERFEWLPVLLLADPATGRNFLWSPGYAPVDPDPLGPPVVGFQEVLGIEQGVLSPILVAWNGVDGRLPRVELGFSSFTILGRAGAEASSAVTCVAPVDGAGQGDLAVAFGGAASAEILVGGGDGDWGRRIAIGTLGPWTAGDVDGDGLDDLIAAVDGPALEVLWGTEHQLARGPITRLALPATDVVAGDFTGSGRASIFLRDSKGGLAVAASGADGRFAPLEPLVVDDADAATAGFWALTLFDPSYGRTPVAVDLGGAEPGLDIAWVSPEFVSGARIMNAFVRDAPGHATYVISPPVDWNYCDVAPGRVAGELLSFCFDSAAREVNVARSVLDLSGIPAFSPWAPVGTGTASMSWSTAAVGVRAAGASAGTGYGLVTDNVGSSTLVTVEADGTIGLQQVATLRWDERPILAELDGAPGVDLLLRFSGLRTLMHGAAGFVSGPSSTRVVGTQVTPVRLSPGAPHDLLIGDPSSPTVMLLRNDGSGRFE